MPLFDEMIANPAAEYIAGGATQNSIRVAQWMLQSPGATVYVGCVGKDASGEKLRACAEADGVAVHYQQDPDTPTGTCAVLVHGTERCLVTKLEAANKYTIEHLHSIRPVWEAARFFYSAGFFLTVSPPSMLAVAEHALEHNKTYCVNLSAPFICQFFTAPLLQVLEYADFVFGNESECEAFGAAMKYEDGASLEAVALRIAALPKKNAARPRTVVITQGAQTTIVVHNGQVAHFAVPKIDKASIVDTNGAGDAFVGGFLSQLAQDKHVFECVRAGHYAAGRIIQVSGTKLSGVPSF
jgi:adenosine kinase